MQSLLQRTFVGFAPAAFTIAGLAIAAVVEAGIPAAAEVISYKAELRGSSEVPPNKSAGVGSVSVNYDTVEKKISWNGSFSGLSGAVTTAHFHGPAAAGRNAGIAVGVAAGALASPFEGSATISDAQAADLKAGRWYVNLHTAAYPAGEIRGQVLK